ncbi:MAG: sugar phosphate isomerase/epimerase [Lachnospiraceae bacterium]|nr:sugar phosphate isomerase/epimerase [Lachnospiraceae bacterium]
MQLGIRLHDIKKASLEERLKIAREQGFKCGHIALKKVIDEYSTADAALTPGLALYLKRLFWENEIDAAVLGNYLNLATPDEAALAKNVKRYKAHMRFASLMDCGVVGTETGAVNTEYKFEERNHSDEALEIFIKNVRPVVEYAEKCGVIFAIEPVYKHIVCNPKRARYVLDQIDSPNLQIIFDPVNLLDVSNIDKRDELFDEAIDLLGEDIAMVHLKDFKVKEDGKTLESVACGKGDMGDSYEKILKFIKTQKPYAHATLENTVPENAVQTREYIQGIYDRL